MRIKHLREIPTGLPFTRALNTGVVQKCAIFDQ